MKRLFTIATVLLLAASATSQTTIHRDREIERMVQEVSKDSLQSYIRQMVAFGTRNTLSSTTDPKRGIGAARNWVVSKFREFAPNAGGRMTVYLDTVTLQPDSAV